MAEPRMVTCDNCQQPREAGFPHTSKQCSEALLARVREGVRMIQGPTNGTAREQALRGMRIADAEVIWKWVEHGWPRTAIIAQVGTTYATIQKVVARMAQANALPEKCRCGLSYGHRRRCLTDQAQYLPAASALKAKAVGFNGVIGQMLVSVRKEIEEVQKTISDCEDTIATAQNRMCNAQERLSHLEAVLRSGEILARNDKQAPEVAG